MPAGVAKAGRADPPRPFQRPVQDRGSAPPQFLAHRVDVVHLDGELEPNSGVARRDLRRLHQLPCLARAQQIHERLAELEDRRVFVLEVDRQAKDLLIEALRCFQVVLEERDRSDPARPCPTFALSRIVHPLSSSSPVDLGPRSRGRSWTLLLNRLSSRSSPEISSRHSPLRTRKSSCLFSPW